MLLSHYFSFCTYLDISINWISHIVDNLHWNLISNSSSTWKLISKDSIRWIIPGELWKFSSLISLSRLRFCSISVLINVKWLRKSTEHDCDWKKETIEEIRIAHHHHELHIYQSEIEFPYTQRIFFSVWK